jgi:NADH-quinone oxidoreductase subunit I
MRSIINYLKDIFFGVVSLLKGLKVTSSYFWKPGAIVTEKYPEKRKDIVMFDLSKGEVIMPHNDKNEHHCTGCGICQINCPNGSIEVTSKTIDTEDGKKKKILDNYIYRLGQCTFCGLCVKNCPSQAITFSPKFEHAVFNKDHLIKILNKPGSQITKGVEK